MLKFWKQNQGQRCSESYSDSHRLQALAPGNIPVHCMNRGKGSFLPGAVRRDFTDSGFMDTLRKIKEDS